MKDTRKVFKSGLFVGKEVEQTPFHGMTTMFVSHGNRLQEALEKMLEVSDVPHLYIGYRLGKAMDETQVLKVARVLLSRDYCVTIDVGTGSVAWPHFRRGLLKLRMQHPDTFCQLITIELSSPDIFGFAIKVEPKQIFSKRANESGVYVLRPDPLASDFTSWDAYKDDKELKK